MVEIISGIKIPDSKIAREATEQVREHKSETLFNHSVRSYLYGALAGFRQSLTFDSDLLYVATLFHDMGLFEAYGTETKPFEIDGADAVREFLRSRGIPESKADLVWKAIALHTTPGIPEHMGPEIALTRSGVLMDVLGAGYDEYTPEQRDRVVAAYPRHDFNDKFIQLHTWSALKKAQIVFGPVNLDHIYCPKFRKASLCARIHSAPLHS
jgi:HD superfamily phosphodiesterase